jgi:hypothetical protein
MVAMVAGAVGAALVGSAGVWAHGGDKEAVHACLAKGGAVRITAAPGWGDPGAVCDEKAGETPLDWGIRGPQGVRGPAGPAGPAGGKGAQEVVYSTTASARLRPWSTRNRRNVVTADLRLPAGAYRLSAGVSIELRDGYSVFSEVAHVSAYRIACALRRGNRGLDGAVMKGGWHDPNGLIDGNRIGSEKLGLSGVFSWPVASVASVRCTAGDTEGFTEPFDVFITLTATPIAKVIEQ